MNVAVPKPFNIFVPFPSFAKTDPEEKLIAAVPACLALKFMISTLPTAPVKPGFNTIPSKLTVPAAFEKDGSCTHKLIIEPVLEIEATSNLSLGNKTTPAAAFMALSGLETITLTGKLFPTVYEPVAGEK